MKTRFLTTSLRRVVLSGVMLSALSLATGYAQNKQLKIGVEGAYPPFSQTAADGNVTGFDVDITFALCKEMNVTCQLVPQEWDGMIPALIARKFDAIVASMSITAERKKKVNFTDKYYSTTASFIAKSDSIQLGQDVKANKQLLEGKRIGVQQATVSDNYVTENYGDVAEIKRYSKQEEANLDLQSGRLDLVFADTVTLDEGFLKTPNGKGFALVSPGYADEQWFGEGIGITVRKGDKTLLKDLNAAIAAIRADGTYDKIQRVYFDYDIYGE